LVYPGDSERPVEAESPFSQKPKSGWSRTQAGKKNKARHSKAGLVSTNQVYGEVCIIS